VQLCEKQIVGYEWSCEVDNQADVARRGEFLELLDAAAAQKLPCSG
jgi:hypothetical protein